MKKVIFFCAGLALMLCSCKSLKTVSYSEVTTLETQPSMYAVPLVADLNVSETRIKYTETVSINLSKLNQLEVNSLLKDLKDAALAHALKAHNADVFVQPQISAENKGQTQIIIEIVGYPAVYKNFRSATPNDDWIINVTRENQQEDASKVQGLKLFGK